MGEYPCHADGRPIEQMRLGSQRQVLVANEVVVDHSFSSKPPCGFYADYHEKMTTYVAILVTEAQALDAMATAQTFPVIPADDEDLVFRYTDTASSRADIALATYKLALGKVSIVGLGGTGAYVLDLVAKTPVKEIHVFDGDTFSQHNAFRSPGAASLDDLGTKPSKVAYFSAIYSRMHRGICDRGRCPRENRESSPDSNHARASPTSFPRKQPRPPPRRARQSGHGHPGAPPLETS